MRYELVNSLIRTRYEFACLFLSHAVFSEAMKDLTTNQAAEALGVAPVTVRMWCRKGRFPNAYFEDTPRGVIWYIPKGDLSGVEPMKPGPKPSTKRKGGVYRFSHS